MKILYAILTCNKTADKKELQKEWIEYIGVGDMVHYLGEYFGQEEQYDKVPLKYSTFIKNCNVFAEYDWVFFGDDDTFVFPKKLHHLLRYFDVNKPIMIGRTGVFEGYTYCSGGAGFAVSRELIFKVKHYLLQNTYELFKNSDTTFGMWAKLAVPDLKIIDRVEQFQTQHLKHDDNALVDIDSCITFHYVGEGDYKILKQYLKYTV